MEIKIDRSTLKDAVVDEKELLNKISSGKAILFTGAGFSQNTKNINGTPPPTAKKLASQICELGGFDKSDDLRYASDLYLQSFGGEKLIPLFKRLFTLVDVSEDHVNICSVNWRRFYTTNYDKSIEISSSKCSKVVECVDLSCKVSEYYKREGVCVHLNGSIDSLNEDEFETSFKLSTSSYISADSFLDSDWSIHFKRDIERCSAIIFVGYSMYDIEVQKLLIQNQYLKEKTYFVIAGNSTPEEKFTLSKFGNVLPIGVDGFSKMIVDNNKLFEGKDDSVYYMQGLSLFDLSDNASEPDDNKVETMLMYGDIKEHFIDSAIVGCQNRPYLVKRDALDTILGFTHDNFNTIIHSEFGNGKSILLRQLKPFLSINSFDVYEISDPDADLIGDLDYLAKTGRPSVIVIDTYEEYLDSLLEHYSSVLPSNIRIIATARSSEHDRLRSKLKDIGFVFNELNIDILSNGEASQFVNIIDNVGMWGEKAGLSHERKIQHLEVKNKLQISLALLALFEAPQIKSRITILIKDLLADSKYKDTIFSISLLEILGLPTKYSLISEVSRNNLIYSSCLYQNKNFKQLFRTDRNEVISKSSLFCLSLIHNHFSPTYTIQQLHNIAKALNSCGYKDFKQEKIFKSCLKFSFIERLLPEANKKNNLRNYYADLKTFVPWLIKDPHYWLQYGMANITFNEFNKAQGFFDQAYALAEKKDNYKTNSIDTQQARLWILLDIHNHDYSFANFQKANRLLERLDDDVYKFRQVSLYRDYFDSCYDHLSKGNKVKLEHACKNMLKAIATAEEYGDIDSISQKSVYHAKNNLEYILDVILGNRKKSTTNK